MNWCTCVFVLLCVSRLLHACSCIDIFELTCLCNCVGLRESMAAFICVGDDFPRTCRRPLRTHLYSCVTVYVCKFLKSLCISHKTHKCSLICAHRSVVERIHEIITLTAHTKITSHHMKTCAYIPSQNAATFKHK